VAINCKSVRVQEEGVIPHYSQGTAGDSRGQDNGNPATIGSLTCELVTAAQTCTV